MVLRVVSRVPFNSFHKRGLTVHLRQLSKNHGLLWGVPIEFYSSYGTLQVGNPKRETLIWTTTGRKIS